MCTCQLVKSGVLCACQGKTAYDIAMEAQNKFAMDTISMGRSKVHPHGLWELLTRQPVSVYKNGLSHYYYNIQTVVWWIMVCAPTIFLVAVGYLGHLAPNWWTYLLGNAAMGYLMRAFL